MNSDKNNWALVILSTAFFFLFVVHDWVLWLHSIHSLCHSLQRNCTVSLIWDHIIYFTQQFHSLTWAYNQISPHLFRRLVVPIFHGFMFLIHPIIPYICVFLPLSTHSHSLLSLPSLPLSLPSLSPCVSHSPISVPPSPFPYLSPSLPPPSLSRLATITRFPIFVVCSESHFLVLYSPTRMLLERLWVHLTTRWNDNTKSPWYFLGYVNCGLFGEYLCTIDFFFQPNIWCWSTCFFPKEKKKSKAG